MLIGPSTGWMYANRIDDISEQEKFTRETRAGAVEMCVGYDTDRIKGLFGGKRFPDISFRTVHFGYNPKRGLKEQVDEIKSIYGKQNFNSSVIHPDNVPEGYWETLSLAAVPISIENMDKKKRSGFDIRELSDLMEKYNFGFVLDAQHAFEHDPTMKYALDLFNMGKNRLKYLHISGEAEGKGNNHVLVHKSRNAKRIIDFVDHVMSKREVPIILEGKYQTPEEVAEEIDFIRNQLMD